MRIAILGGTYNPVHIGHMFLAKEIEHFLNVDKIIFIPTHKPVHKRIESISVKDRIEMLKLAIQHESKMFVDECDIVNGGITYTVDTIACIKNKYIYDEIYLIIGDDLFKDFDSWKNPEVIVESVNLVIVHRIYNEEIISQFKHTYINNKIFPISSSEIRSRIEKGLPVDYLLPFDVLQYIKNNNLYVKGK
ncbi:nicotinate (nicotinamide) nucleotide adenylyltransferase [Borrelia miyamotoi]|uniref:Probable nicotinate-nucleotide adenylyltransferase n=1 Tax=Borrelia miyamotoi TaxID=47466 RepID=A0AAQ3AGA6_9SPIR|nr:nicotinate (nicotinamide) nucleotide adenylyltransferase [Borrelia miyamotoi]AGT27725.1 nicotinic acid mononucleotide adenylyltransferase [Borrelia miyamotoi LB-2001]AJA58874.1 nicotinic acid mononucleotide adenylyltransferase [Borrelia miyamotoi]AOW95965.1 nicotinate (nicotinamide) nucleotide adenylyltransferase [Borrelia miyamotoi]QTL83859.1 nicotinate (nicotinamide) nucleotide adenylyltransferase [Borrelia miyamotoi]WAZ84835.1 nicotinate (nicotinamide) nucleotide adenylyltransferase [Bor